MRTHLSHAAPRARTSADSLAVHRVTVMGLPVDAVTLTEAIRLIECALREGEAAVDQASGAGLRHPWHVVTLNPEIVMAARRDPSLRDIVRRAALVTADGIGVVLAGRLAGFRVPERVTGIDLLLALAPVLAASGHSIFLLGGTVGVAEQAADRLRTRAPGLRVAGTYAGRSGPEGDEDAVERIRAARPAVLVAAYGAPAQERWIARNLPRTGCAVAVGVGGALDMLAGRVTRAPRWMRRSGLEWLYRLWRQPWRWRRMLALPRFAVLAIGDVVIARMRRQGASERNELAKRR